MARLQWNRLLFNLNAKRIEGDIHSVQVKILGESQIGPYDELLKFVKDTSIYQTPVEVHHIVNGEHLDGTGWLYESAPCIVMSKSMHQQYHARFSEVLPGYHSRVHEGKLSKKHTLQLYHDIFVEQTCWLELWTIAARILTGKVQVPTKNTIWRGE